LNRKIQYSKVLQKTLKITATKRHKVK